MLINNADWPLAGIFQLGKPGPMARLQNEKCMIQEDGFDVRERGILTCFGKDQ